MAGRSTRRRALSAGTIQAGTPSSPSGRKSERSLSSATQPFCQGKPNVITKKMVGSPRPGLSVTRPITLKKIMPRSQQDRVKETTLICRRSPRFSLKQNKENCPLGAAKKKSPSGVDGQRKAHSPPPPSSLDLEAGNPLREPDLPSPGSAKMQDPPPDDERDLVMTKRVRRSYSRQETSFSHRLLEKEAFPCSNLTDTSIPSHSLGKRQTLFGFEKLLLPAELDGLSPLNASCAPRAIAADSAAAKEPDTDIPGISFGREKRKKKKVPQFDKSELDKWAAQMNAEFEEAERFDLLVE